MNHMLIKLKRFCLYIKLNEIHAKICNYLLITPKTLLVTLIEHNVQGVGIRTVNIFSCINFIS